ncbi:MAG: SDR family NAD(P)-dependent oxidoreductase [Myxococcota bacterium]|jgi:NAD(P)-dependent dehydrogenase (short-subunit alcohol dehydrogenase family)|nr:SDR family NAD(P)-dependent oxidoreductase [Myxococcota bacterium]
MKSFAGKIAVVTGGGTGMGRELTIQLAKEGCHVAMCDVSNEAMQQTRELALKETSGDVRVTSTIADVADETQMLAWRTAVMEEHDTKSVNLVFNNAGIGGTPSFVDGDREEWERTFNICWFGVYYGSRVFMPLLVASNEGHLVNTSSVNGFWASVGPNSTHSAYSTAKFAVKGFSEALINDLRMNAPHVKVSVVMPGHIGTSIIANSGKILGNDPKEMGPEQFAIARERMEQSGIDASQISDDEIRQAIIQLGEAFRDEAPTSAAAAAKVILDGVREERWRILIGHDAEVLDRMVRGEPEDAYTQDFYDRLTSETDWRLGALSDQT